MRTILNKVWNLLVRNPRRKGLGDSSVILDRNFGSGRGTPIDRVLITDFLEKQLPKKTSKLKILEFGDSHFSRKFFDESSKYVFQYQNDAQPEVDEEGLIVRGDLMAENSRKLEIFDVIIATQLLAFTQNPFQAVKGLVDLLKPNGIILGTEPFCSPISQYDNERWGDYFRFTTKGVEVLFSKLQNSSIEVYPLGNWESTYAIYKGFCKEDNLAISNIPDATYATNVGYVFHKRKMK